VHFVNQNNEIICESLHLQNKETIRQIKLFILTYLATTLGSQQPVQAFVVANQVTSQQSMDRNIVNNASIG
jgi:hypothetical protein